MRNGALSSFVVLFCFGCIVSPAYADVWDKEWSLLPNAQIRLNANYGNIRVNAGDFTKAKASVRTVGWRIGKDGVSVNARQTDNGIELEVKLLTGRRYWQVGHEITIELTVPAGAGLDLHTDQGNISTAGMKGALRSDTGDGNIEAVGGEGSIRLRTGDGNINARDLDGSLSAETGDGNINLEGRFEVLDARTGDGNLAVTALGGSRLSSGWNLRTGDGNVLLRAQDALSADLDVTTGGGRVTVDFPVATSGKVNRETVRGPMNGGGPQLSIHTGDGNIDILKH